MLEWFRNKFIFNHQLAARCRELERSLQGITGQNEILSKWNEELKAELKETRELLYKKSGITDPYSAGEPGHQKPIQKIETWRTARSKLETATKLPVDWEKKEREAIAKGDLSG